MSLLLLSIGFNPLGEKKAENKLQCTLESEELLLKHFIYPFLQKNPKQNSKSMCFQKFNYPLIILQPQRDGM